MTKRNILFVNERPFNPILGGIERVTDTLTKTLVARGGYSVFYLCGKVATKDIQSLDYYFPAQLYTLPEDGLFQSEKNIEFYENLLKKLNIDIVINQRGLNGGFNNILTIGNVKRISVLHSKPNSQINHNVARILLFSKEPKEQIKKYIKVLFYPFFYYRAIIKAKKYLRKAYHKLVENSDAIVLLSSKDKAEFLSNGVDIKNKILCGIPNPNGLIVEDNLSLEKKDRIVLYVGRLDQFKKNVLCLIKIWNLLYIKFPQWKLVIVGDGPDKDRIQKYIRKNKIENVSLEGGQPNVENYYKKASFICLTSFYEGWGMSLTEGMQYGCIPFTFDNYGAASDIIDDNINGCLVDAFDEKEYANRLSHLMNDDDKRLEMSRAAIEKVKLFSAENIVDKWEKLFEKVNEDESSQNINYSSSI